MLMDFKLFKLSLVVLVIKMFFFSSLCFLILSVIGVLDDVVLDKSDEQHTVGLWSQSEKFFHAHTVEFMSL